MRPLPISDYMHQESTQESVAIRRNRYIQLTSSCNHGWYRWFGSRGRTVFVDLSLPYSTEDAERMILK